MAGRHEKRSKTWFHVKRGWALLLPLAIVASMMIGTAGYTSTGSQTDQTTTSTDTSTQSDAPSTDPSTADPATSDPSPAVEPSPSATDTPTDSPSQEPSPTDTSSATNAPSDAPSPTDASSPSETSSPTSSDQAPSATRTLLVRLVSGLSDADIADAIAAGGGTEMSSVDALRLYVVDVPADSVDASVAEYSSDTRVQSVDRDRMRDAEATPNDPAYGSQWALSQIGWDQVYGSTNPQGVATIAVLDTGVQSNDAPTGLGWSAFGTDPTVDPNGHGTWVASIAAATPDNGQGIAGVGFAGVDVMPVQVLSADGTGQDSDIIAGLVWAADHGANVAVMAFSNPGYSSALQDAVNYAWNHGVVVVAAAGNDGAITPNYPAGDAKVVGVGATDQNDQLWSGSNQSNAVFLTAPGVDIKADAVGGGTDLVTGTSMSAAIVAGAAAQLVAVDPYATPGTIVGRLARNAAPDGGVGNGRLSLSRSLNDTSTDEIVPDGAPSGGPIVGPYVAAANRKVTVTLSGTGTGIVTGSGVDCGNTGAGGHNTCTSNVNTTQPATLTATPGAGSVFSGWGTPCSGTGQCTLPASSGDQTVSATFTAVQTITVTVSGTQTFGGSPSYTYGQSPASPAVAGSLSGCSTDATSSSNVGTGYHVLIAGCTGLTTDANHVIAYADGGFTVTKASTTTVVSCTSPVTYTGSPLTPCTVSVTGAGGLTLTPTPTYSNNTNVGTASASYTYAGDANHTGSSDSTTFQILKATITVTVSGTQTYAGTAGFSFTQSPTSPGVGGSLSGCGTDATAASPVGTSYHVLVATCAGLTTDGNHQITYADGGFAVTRASSTTVVTCPVSKVYTGSAIEPCTVAVTGAGGLSLTPTPSYSNNTNVGTANATYTYIGDANHTGSSNSTTFQILKATITVTVSGTQTFAGTPGYSFGQSPVAPAVGGALAGCATDATGSSPVGSSYHVLVATCTGLTTDANHQIAYADGGLTVTKANSSTVVNCPSSVIFSGTAQTPCSASITGAGGLSLSPAPGYANNTGPGVATASYTYGGDGNHYGSNGSANFLIQYSSGPCLGSPGRQILQPINADGSSVFKQGSTVPAKFRVCDSAGNSVGTSGLVTSFVLWKTNSGTGDVTVNEAVVSTTPDTAFRWDPTDKQWIFNIDTKGMSKNKTYTYVITLNDTTTIQFSFGLK